MNSLCFIPFFGNILNRIKYDDSSAQISYADRRERDDRYAGREWGGRDRYEDRGSRGSRMMTSTVQAAGKYDLPQIDNKRV